MPVPVAERPTHSVGTWSVRPPPRPRGRKGGLRAETRDVPRTRGSVSTASTSASRRPTWAGNCSWPKTLSRSCCSRGYRTSTHGVGVLGRVRRPGPRWWRGRRRPWDPRRSLETTAPTKDSSDQRVPEDGPTSTGYSTRASGRTRNGRGGHGGPDKGSEEDGLRQQGNSNDPRRRPPIPNRVHGPRGVGNPLHPQTEVCSLDRGPVQTGSRRRHSKGVPRQGPLVWEQPEYLLP